VVDLLSKLPYRSAETVSLQLVPLPPYITKLVDDILGTAIHYLFENRLT